MTVLSSVLAVAVMALVTAGLRFAPFLFLNGKKTPALVVYCLKDTGFSSPGAFLPQLFAGAVVVGSYVWKKNTLLSIIAGTAVYMLLVQLVF